MYRRRSMLIRSITTGQVVLPDPLPLIGLPIGKNALHIQTWAERAIKQFNLEGWEFGFDNALRRMGCCNYTLQRISMSRHFLAENGPVQFRNTLLHEIAHAIVGPGHGHNSVWRSIALKIGCNGRRCSNADMPEGNWKTSCGGCGMIATRHKKPKRLTGWFCKKCGRSKGELEWHFTG